MSFLREFNELYLNVTYRCNLDCPFCSTRAGGFFNKDLDMREDVVSAAVDILLSNSATNEPQLFFFGGEPLLRMDLIKKCVNLGRKSEGDFCKKIRFVIVTNGVLLTDDFLGYLAENDVELQINLDGPKEVHDSQRYFPGKKSTFDIIISNIRKALTHKKLRLALRSHVPPKNLHFHKTMEILNELKLNDLHIAFTMVMGMEKNSEFLWSKKDYIANEELFTDFVRKYEDNILMKKAPTVDFFGLLGYYSNPSIKMEQFCSAGRNRLSIGPEGDIYPCFTMENQKEFNLGSIDKGINIFNTTRFLTTISESGLTAEDGSDIRDLFKYFCPYQNWTLSGKLNVVCNELRESYEGYSYIVEKMKEELKSLEEGKSIKTKSDKAASKTESKEALS